MKKGKGNVVVRQFLDMIEGYEPTGEMVPSKSMIGRRSNIVKGNNRHIGNTTQIQR